MKQFSLVLVLALAIGSVSVKGYSEEVSGAARDLLIEKLSKVVLQLPEGDSSKVNITLRLADLLAERARIAQRDQLAGEVNGAKVANDGGRADRTKALRYYQDVLPKLTTDISGRVLTQVGHLYQMNNEEAKAIDVYQKIINSSAPTEVINEAQFSLAEVFFKRRQYEQARGYYAKVMNSEVRSAKGFAAYRLAWCEFYAGNPPQAAAIAEKILTTPKLLTRTASMEVVQVDAQFQEEVATDYVTFAAQAGVSGAAEKVYQYSPEKARLSLLFALSTEFERLGKKAASIESYRFLQQKENRPLFKLEGQVRLAQLEMETKDVTPALNDYDKAIQLWPEVCGAGGSAAGSVDHCKELSTRLKNFVIDWHKSEKNAPSENLFNAYKLYLSRFPTPEMAFQAALIAKGNKNYPEADALFASSAKEFAAAHKAGNKEAASTGGAGSPAVKLEASLLSRIEIAEMAKDEGMQFVAWNAYLQGTVQNTKSLEVEYQLARAAYAKNSDLTAAEALKAVVFSKSQGASDLREKAADLALDALATLKNDTLIEKWAREFAVKIPSKSPEFNQLAAKAGLNTAANLANTASSADALKALKAVDVKSLSVEDRVQYLKNRLLLAEKNQQWPEARMGANEMLAEKSLSTEDRDFALEHKAYLAELILDFKTALAALKDQSKKAPTLRLALMAELAREDGTAFYRARLQETTDEKEKISIATKLIRDSKTPEKEWAAQKAVFSKEPNTYAHLALELLAGGKAPQMGEILKKDKTMANTPAYKALARESVFDQYEALAKEVGAHQLSTENDRKMAASIKQRAALLTKTEVLAKTAVTVGDFTSQVIALELLAKESSRFYMDLLGLPVPQGLTPEEEKQYMAILSEQAGPHRAKAEEITAKVKELWTQTGVLSEIQGAYASETASIQKILAREIRLLSAVATGDVKANLDKILAAPATAPVVPVTNVAQIERAREELRQDPLNKSKVEGLLAVERQLGASPMVSYLEQRLENLSKNQGVR